MSLDDIESVDAVGTEREENAVVLSIVDSWDWEDEEKHLSALQEKLNAYFGFVESGQIYKNYPDAMGKSLRIDLISRHPMTNAGLDFLKKASSVAAQLNITITNRIH